MNLTRITGHRSFADVLAKEVGSEVWYGAIVELRLVE
jgi:hypothetical protein